MVRGDPGSPPRLTPGHGGPEASGVTIGYRGTGLRAHSIHTTTGPPETAPAAGLTLTTPKVMCCPCEHAQRLRDRFCAPAN